MSLLGFVDAWRLSRAESALISGRPQAAANVLSRIGAEATNSHRAWRLRARIMMVSNRPLEAVAFYTRAVSTQGVSLCTIHELAHALIRVRDFDRAESVLRRLLEEMPEDRRAVQLLARLFGAQGRFETAFTTIKTYRPRHAVSKYAYSVATTSEPASWNDEDFDRALLAAGKLGNRWQQVDAMAADPEQRDELICFFDELARSPSGRRALLAGIRRALPSDAPWLIRYIRSVEPYLRLSMPASLPSYLARHGGREDRRLLLAGLAEGGPVRLRSALALIALGWTEFDEVIREMRDRAADHELPSEDWSLVEGMAGV